MTLCLLINFFIAARYLIIGGIKYNKANEKYGVRFADYFSTKKKIPDGYNKETNDALKMAGKAFLLFIGGSFAIAGINYLLTRYF